MVSNIMTKKIKWILLAITVIYCSCSAHTNTTMEPDGRCLSADIFNSIPDDLRVRKTDYFIEIRIDTLKEILSPKTYTIYHGIVSPMPRDYSVLLLKVRVMDDYHHVDNPFFWASFNETSFVEEYTGTQYYGINKSVERYDSLYSIGEIPTHCNYLFLPIKRDSLENVIKIMEEGVSIIVDDGRESGDTVWSSCYYQKEDVDFSLLLSFKQRVSILDSLDAIVRSRLGDSIIIPKQ